MPWLAWAALGGAGSSGGDDVRVVEVELRSFRPLGTRLVLEISEPPGGAKNGRVVVAQAGEPLGWFDPAEVGDEGVAFVSRQAVKPPSEAKGLRAWFIGSNLVEALYTLWPVDAELRAKVDTVGLGAVTVWIGAGSNHGVAVGDRWWRRVNGQPVARCDVRLVGQDVCFCRVVPLVASLRLVRGDMVSLWPAPGQRRAGRAMTAVSFVETDGDEQIVWVAAPRGIDVPAEPRLDFYRDGRYVGSGAVERRDTRFWYVRTLWPAGRSVVRVGDDAVIRTSADIERRRVCFRVFEQTPTGGLINGGEVDGLSAGDLATVYRDGRRIGCLKLAKVQRGYSVGQFVADSEHTATTQTAPGTQQRPVREPDGLERLDEVRFRPPEEPTPTLAVIERVIDETLFSARITGVSATPLLRPLAVRRAGRVLGVAILLDAADGRALGFALACSMTAPLVAGDELTLSAEVVSQTTRERLVGEPLHRPV